MTRAVSSHLEKLCSDIGERPVGSPANRAATRHAASVLAGFGFEVECPRFRCLSWKAGGVTVKTGRHAFPAYPGPYSPPYAGRARLVTAGTLRELRDIDPSGCILLLHGRLVREPLAPRNYVFYNPEAHRRIYRLLDRRPPAAVIAATGRCPSTAGAVYPFALFDDGDFDIPSAYMKDTDGTSLLRHEGAIVDLEIASSRTGSYGCNVIARLPGRSAPARIVLTAHIDTRPGTPGALDDASGVATILAAAALASRRAVGGVLPGPGLEIAVLNGEDYYAASGEMSYMKANEGLWEEIVLAVNVDGAGYREGGTASSLYGCGARLERACSRVLEEYSGIRPGEEWVQGDHSMFVMQGVPALAFTSSEMGLLWSEIAHTERDRIDLVDPRRLDELARAIDSVMQIPPGLFGRVRR